MFEAIVPVVSDKKAKREFFKKRGIERQVRLANRLSEGNYTEKEIIPDSPVPFSMAGGNNIEAAVENYNQAIGENAEKKILEKMLEDGDYSVDPTVIDRMQVSQQSRKAESFSPTRAGLKVDPKTRWYIKGLNKYMDRSQSDMTSTQRSEQARFKERMKEVVSEVPENE